MLTTNQSYVTYQGNGATIIFPFGFIIPSASDLVVSITNNNASPAATTILSSTQYTATGIGNQSGGNVTYPVSGSPLPAGWSITIQRIVPYAQDTSLTNQGAFYPAVVEACLDDLTMQTQQLAAQMAGAAPIVAANITLEDESTRAVYELISNHNALGLGGGQETVYCQMSLGYVTVQQYGAIADSGVTDNTAAFQAALNAVGAGGVVFVPSSGTGYYGFASADTLTMPSGVSLIGASTSQSYDASNSVPEGSILGITNTVNQFVTIGSNCRLEGLTFYYPNQVLTGTPVVFPPTIGQPSSGTVNNFTLRNCVAFNCYDFVKMTTLFPMMDMRISDISGDFIHYGFQIDNQDNLVWMRNIYDKPFSSNGAYLAWRRANSVLFVLGSIGIWADRIYSDCKWACIVTNQGGSLGNNNLSGPGGYIYDLTTDDSTNGIIFNCASTFGLTVTGFECALTQNGYGLLFQNQINATPGGSRVFVRDFTLWGTYSWGIIDQIGGILNFSNCALLGNGTGGDINIDYCNATLVNVGTLSGAASFGSHNTQLILIGNQFASAPTIAGLPSIYLFADNVNLSDAQAGTQSISANQVWASPGGASGPPNFRALVSADIPNNAANTSGTAANLSGTPALPNGTTAATQATGDSSAKLATTEFVANTLAYSSGTWTPVLNNFTIVDGTGGVTVSGTYIKIGHLIWVNCIITGTGTASIASIFSSSYISGLPFNPANLTSAVVWIGATGATSSAYLSTNGSINTNSWSAVTASAGIIITGCYSE